MSKKSNKPLSEETVGRMAALLADGNSNLQVAEMLGIGETSVRKYAKKLGPALVKAAMNSEDPFIKLARENQRLKEELSANRRIVRQANSTGAGYDDFMETLKRFVEVEKLEPLTYFPTQITKAKKSDPIPFIDKEHSEILCLAISDWHLTEVVRLLDSNGINEYNSLIAANRLWELVQKIKQIAAIHMAVYKITKIKIFVLGDMISGRVHPEFLETNDATDHVAAILCVRLMEMFLLELKALGLPMELECVCGNHPRTTPKVPTKGLAHTNWDWLVYMFSAMNFNGDDQVKFNVWTSQIGHCLVLDHRYVFEHGIQWKNGQEESLESNIRDLMDDPIYREATGLTGAAFDQVVIGNLHKPAFLERTVKNGSLIGQNELGQQWRLRPIRAQQLMWGVSKTHARTFQYQLDLTRVKSKKVDNPFSEFTKMFLADHGRYQLA